MSPEDKIENQAKAVRKHLEGIADNTKRRVVDEDSWYIGMLRGRELSLEWALRELRGEDHEKANEAIMNDTLEYRLRPKRT